MRPEVLLIKNKARLEKMVIENYPLIKIEMQERKIKRIKKEIEKANNISK